MPVRTARRPRADTCPHRLPQAVNWAIHARWHEGVVVEAQLVELLVQSAVFLRRLLHDLLPPRGRLARDELVVDSVEARRHGLGRLGQLLRQVGHGVERARLDGGGDGGCKRRLERVVLDVLLNLRLGWHGCASAHPAHRNVSITACAAKTYVHEVRVGLKPHCLIAELGARTSGWRLQSEGGPRTCDVRFRRVDFFVGLHQCSSRLGTLPVPKQN